MADEKREDKRGSSQGIPTEREHFGSGSDTEESAKVAGDEHQRRERALDKTLADSFPTSDPPSSIPDPDEEDAA